MTKLLGDNIVFTDSTEYTCDHGVRSFTSFNRLIEKREIAGYTTAFITGMALVAE